MEHSGDPTHRIADQSTHCVSVFRQVLEHLVARYEAAGWWTQETLGDLVAAGLAKGLDVDFHVHSAVRPYTGTFRDVELVARWLAAGLRRRGVGPGDVIAVQLPNWMEAAAAFLAAAMLGAVVVPIVHSYGRKEVGHIVATAHPRVFVTAERFGRWPISRTCAWTLPQEPSRSPRKTLPLNQDENRILTRG